MRIISHVMESYLFITLCGEALRNQINDDMWQPQHLLNSMTTTAQTIL